MLNIELLQDRGIVAVSGDDSRSFLQGLITNNIAKVNEKQAIFACLLSPQGKFLYDFFIIESQGNLLIETEKSIIPELVKRLSFYKLRAKVEIKELPNLQVGWIESKSSDDTFQNNDVIFSDPRSNELGMRIIAEDLTPGEEESTYDSTRIKLGIAEGSKDLTTNRSLPIEFGYDKINAIDFNKGCYVGQEVTARSKHRATLHKFIHFIEAKSTLP
ncbi:MAG: folate-binding protein, partial [Pseudomonadota bacterium]